MTKSKQHSSQTRQFGSAPHCGPIHVELKEAKVTATQDDLRAVAGKAVSDPDFRQKLIEDPKAAVKEAGIDLTDEQMKALKETDKEQLEQGMAELDKRLTMACWIKFIESAPCAWG